MDILVNFVKEGCCDSQLSSYSIIDMDCLDDVGSTCDKIIECSEKYILVEEKSILFAFFNNCCNELHINLDDTYKYIDNGVKYLKISDLIDEVIHPMNEDTKKRILSDTIVNMLSTSAKKASNTTDILNKRFDNTKTSNMSVFYLYCNSGKPIDRIMTTWLSRYKKIIFIECFTLQQRLQSLPC